MRFAMSFFPDCNCDEEAMEAGTVTLSELVLLSVLSVDLNKNIEAHGFPVATYYTVIAGSAGI